MIEKCKIKLVFKAEEPARLFQAISRQNKPSTAPVIAKEMPGLQKSGRPREACRLTTGLKAAIIE
jgi:hypothetical protein